MIRIKELRNQSNLSLRDLAQNLNISYSSLGKYERGEQQPNIETLLNIAKYFDVTVDYLLGNSNYKNTQEEFNFKNAIILSEEKELLNLFKRTASCYEFLIKLYEDNNIRRGTSCLSKQLIHHLKIIIFAYEQINEFSPNSIEEIGEAIGSFHTLIDMNFDSMNLSRELAHFYKNYINPPATE